MNSLPRDLHGIIVDYSTHEEIAKLAHSDESLRIYDLVAMRMKSPEYLQMLRKAGLSTEYIQQHVQSLPQETSAKKMFNGHLLDPTKPSWFEGLDLAENSNKRMFDARLSKPKESSWIEAEDVTKKPNKVIEVLKSDLRQISEPYPNIFLRIPDFVNRVNFGQIGVEDIVWATKLVRRTKDTILSAFFARFVEINDLAGLDHLTQEPPFGLPLSERAAEIRKWLTEHKPNFPLVPMGDIPYPPEVCLFQNFRIADFCEILGNSIESLNLDTTEAILKDPRFAFDINPFLNEQISIHLSRILALDFKRFGNLIMNDPTKWPRIHPRDLIKCIFILSPQLWLDNDRLLNRILEGIVAHPHFINREFNRGFARLSLFRSFIQKRPQALYHLNPDYLGTVYREAIRLKMQGIIAIFEERPVLLSQIPAQYFFGIDPNLVKSASPKLYEYLVSVQVRERQKSQAGRALIAFFSVASHYTMFNYMCSEHFTSRLAVGANAVSKVASFVKETTRPIVNKIIKPAIHVVSQNKNHICSAAILGFGVYIYDRIKKGFTIGNPENNVDAEIEDPGVDG